MKAILKLGVSGQYDSGFSRIARWEVLALVRRLAAALRRKPSERLLARQAEIPDRVRERRVVDDGQRRRTPRSELWTAFVKS